MSEKVSRNINKYLVYISMSRALFYLPIFVIFYNELGVPYSVVMLFFSVLSVVKFLLEVPSGSFADNVGRKKTLILSLMFKIVSLFLLVILAFFVNKVNLLGYIAIIISTVFFGLGEVLESGTADALIYDYLKFCNEEDLYKDVTSKANSLVFFTFSISGITGSIMYSVNRSIPYIVTLVAFVFSFISILSFNEINLSSKDKKSEKLVSSTFATIIKSFKELKSHKFLINIMLYG